MAQLNEEQVAAVQHPLDEPACLIAGAGSGKTKVLTERVRWLMEQGIPPRRICCITFTNKAAGELVERLGITEETPYDQCPKVSTIHSLALVPIRRSPQEFGFPSGKVTPLDDYEQTQLMKKLIERTFPERKEPAAFAFSILEKVKFHRARGVGFSDGYTEEVHERAKIEHAGYHALEADELRLWKLYEKEKTKNSVLDFDDMLHLQVRRIRTDERWRNTVARMFDHVLMDEAQDTNPVQWEFVNALCGPENRNMYVVGDMSQSIYAFSGAVPALLKEYSESWRGITPKLYRISRNHRSLPRIINLANAIQQKMTATIPLKMKHFRGNENELGVTKILKGDYPTNIAGAIAAEICRDASVANSPILYKENCILVRSAAQVRDIEGALVRFRIPYVVRGGRGLLQTEEVRDVLAYLRLAINPKDFMAFVRSASTPKRGVGEVAMEKLRQIADKEFDGDLIAASVKLDKLEQWVAIMRNIQKAKEDPVNALSVILAETKYRSYIENKHKKEPEKAEKKLENLERFTELVQGLLEETPMSTDDLVFQLTLDKGRENDKEGMVTISTIHAAKGLEWKRVYIPTCYETSLPHKWSMGSPEEIEEERRLFYVAVTRARDICVIGIPAMTSNGLGKPQPLAPSRFLYEVGIV